MAFLTDNKGEEMQKQIEMKTLVRHLYRIGDIEKAKDLQKKLDSI